MKPDISEFSYGYAVTSELVQKCGTTLAGAPIFPSLIEEGQLGYDLELPIIGCPIFLQFKLTDHMVGGLAKGADKVGTPHYRMHLRSLKYSKQHNLLLALEGNGHSVFYCAPEFHLPVELNDAYLKNEVLRRSAFFRPKAIGSLNDDEHFVCFNAGSSYGYRYSSRPTRIEREVFDVVVNTLFGQTPNGDANQLSAKNYLWNVANELISDWIEVNPDSRWLSNELEKLRANRGPLEYLGWVAQTLFDCRVFVRLQQKKE